MSEYAELRQTVWRFFDELARSLRIPEIVCWLERIVCRLRG